MPTSAFAVWWIAHKGALVATLGLSRDLLHLAIGGVAFVVLLAMLRVRSGAWLAIAAIEVTNELADLLAARSLDGALLLPDTMSDIALTLLVPTILWSWLAVLDIWFPAAHRPLAARRRRRSGRRRASRTAARPA